MTMTKQRRRDEPQETTPPSLVQNPSITEQKRLRHNDLSIVPSAPALLLSKTIDAVCDGSAYVASGFDGGGLCPSDWRSALPRGWGDFPDGPLGHSFSGSLSEDIREGYVTYGDYLESRGIVGGVASGEKDHAAKKGGGDEKQKKGLFSSKKKKTAAPVESDASSNVDPGRFSALPSLGEFDLDADSISTSLGNAYDYAFHTPSTPLSVLTTPMSLSVLLVLVLFLRTFKRLCLPRFSALGRRLGRSAHGPSWVVDNEDRVEKFGEYVFRLLYHSAVSVYGIWYFRDKVWWNAELGGTVHLFKDHPNHPVEPGMAWYYLIQCAYNVDALVSLLELSFRWEWVNPASYSTALPQLLADPKGDDAGDKSKDGNAADPSLLWTPLFRIAWSPTVRGDFREMMAHHFVTNALVFGSSYYRFARIGSMVFLVHDVSDVPVDLSKLANFVKWKITTILCFLSMVVVWIITRLAIYPFVIYRSVLFESWTHLVEEGPVDPAIYKAYCGFFFALMGALVLLHVTWFLILLRIGWALVSKGERHDYTEHKRGEANGGEGKRKAKES